jgi:hypothetical protein
VSLAGAPILLELGFIRVKARPYSGTPVHKQRVNSQRSGRSVITISVSQFLKARPYSGTPVHKQRVSSLRDGRRSALQ